MNRRAPPKETILAVNGSALAIVIALWWLLSLVVVRLELQMEFVAPLLETVRQAVPAAQKYAEASGFVAATTGFYLFFLISSPFAVFFYSRVMTMRRALGGGFTIAMWLVIALVVFLMTLGLDLGPVESKGFRRSFNLILTSSWMGSSFVFLLFCHCLVMSIVCIAKDKRIKGEGSHERRHCS